MDIAKLKSILACEIEAGIFEQHVLPALEVVQKVAESQAEQAPLHDEETAYKAWFCGEQGKPYKWMFDFGKAAWMARAATQPEPVNQQLLAAANAVIKADKNSELTNDEIDDLESAIAAAEAAQQVKDTRALCMLVAESAYRCATGRGAVASDVLRQIVDDVLQQPAGAWTVAVPATRELTDDELWAIRNHVAINEVTRDDDSRTICIKQGRAVIRAMLSAAQKGGAA